MCMRLRHLSAACQRLLHIIRIMSAMCACDIIMMEDAWMRPRAAAAHGRPSRRGTRRRHAMAMLGLLAASALEAAAFDPRAEQIPRHAASVAAAAGAAGASPIFRPQTFGALADGKHNDTAAVVAAVTACSASVARGDGCSLLFSGGSFLTGPFVLPSHSVITVAKGATVLAAPGFVGDLPSGLAARLFPKPPPPPGLVAGFAGARHPKWRWAASR